MKKSINVSVNLMQMADSTLDHAEACTVKAVLERAQAMFDKLFIHSPLAAMALEGCEEAWCLHGRDYVFGFSESRFLLADKLCKERHRLYEESLNEWLMDSTFTVYCAGEKLCGETTFADIAATPSVFRVQLLPEMFMPKRGKMGLCRSMVQGEPHESENPMKKPHAI